MPVDSKHAKYETRAAEWEDCRDAAEGSRAIKAKGARYLKPLKSQDTDQYDAYKQRALWYGATGRTIQGLVGSIFRKPMQVEMPAAMEEHAKDITMTGVNLEGFAKTALAEVLKTGRYGILVDLGTDSLGAERPYWAGYTAERITNWATQQIKGNTVLTLVVLFEDAEEDDPADPFVKKCIPQYRVLRLLENAYTVQLWRKSHGDEGKWEVHQEIVPQFRGRPLDYIPFCFVGPTSITTHTEKPPLLDLVDVNISHYQSSADLEHGRHFCGLPTPWVAGFPTDTVLYIGSAKAWVSTDPAAHCGMLEFTGQGLGALENALTEKQALMAILGARMLEEQKKAVESAETHTIRNAGESSSLQSIAGTAEQALTLCLFWHAAWMGLTSAKANLELNKVFVEARMDPNELQVFMQAYQSGAISYETFYWNLQRGELTRPGVDAEEERQTIDSQPPVTLPLEEETEEEVPA